MEYSKKQIQPLVEKYSINVNTNDIFKKIIAMFEDQTNYQVWAIKSVFDGNCSFETISTIKRWIDENKNEIKNLIKGNVVSYKSSREISGMLREIEGLTVLSVVRNGVNRFNTRQRDMLKEELFSDIKNGHDVLNSPKLMQWHKIFVQLEKLPNHRKEKLISTASAIDNVPFLLTHIKSAFAQSYKWDKEDLLTFAAINTPDCSVVYDCDDIVIMKIPSFASSKTLCGNGRTGWCLTREEHYFKSYTSDKAIQYFLFNFGVREDDELAHVGFTVRKGSGVVNAHSTRNYNLIGGGIRYKNEPNVNITRVFDMLHVPQRLISGFEESKYFKWNIESILEFVSKNSNNIGVCCEVNGKLILHPTTNLGLQMLIEHSNFKTNFQNDIQVYVIFDLAKPFDDNKSIVVARYKKDKYGCLSMQDMYDGYRNSIMSKDYFKEVGIDTSMFLNRDDINPSILLHKLIDEGNEKEAVSLIEKNPKDLDVNFELENVSPVFNAIRNKMFKLFDAIVTHKTFDSAVCDCFGETILSSLIYNYFSENSKEEEGNLVRMIESILISETFDFNQRDINLSTALIISCEKSKGFWITERLLKNPNVNVNIVDDINCTALGTAIRKKNLDAIRLLARREDIVVRQRDLDLAEMSKIDLSKFFSKEVLDNAKNNVLTFGTNDDKVVQKLSEIFSQAFGLSK